MICIFSIETLQTWGKNFLILFIAKIQKAEASFFYEQKSLFFVFVS